MAEVKSAVLSFRQYVTFCEKTSISISSVAPRPQAQIARRVAVLEDNQKLLLWASGVVCL